MIELIYACDLSGGIGLDNDLPWPLMRADMQWFKEKTTNKVVVMGSNTWFSLPKKLPNRINVVVSTRDASEFDDADLVVSGDCPLEIVDKIKAVYPDKDICVIGGATVYTLFVPIVQRVYQTIVMGNFPHDTVFNMQILLNTSANKTYESKVFGDERFGTPDLLFQTFERSQH